MQAPTLPLDPSPFAAVFDHMPAAKLGVPPLIVNMISTRGFAAVGDFGQGNYKRVASNPGWARASFQTADGQWWLLCPQGMIWGEQFGMVADCPVWQGSASASTVRANPVGVTDNWPAALEAMQFSAGQGVGVGNANAAGSCLQLRFAGLSPAKCYWFSQSFVPPNTVNLYGSCTALDQDASFGTTFSFPANTPMLILNHAATQPAGYAAVGAYGSRIKGIRFLGGGGTDRTAHAVWQRCVATIEDCVVDNMSGNGYHNVGYTVAGYTPSNPKYGQSSHTRVSNFTVRNCGNIGWNVEGSDISASQFDNIQIKDARISAVRDIGYFANFYNNLQINTIALGRTGACWYNGRNYQLIADRTDANTVTPGSDYNTWEDLGPAAAASGLFPAFSSTATYEQSSPVFCTNYSVFTGYLEIYYLAVHGPNGARFQGTWAGTRNTCVIDGYGVNGLISRTPVGVSRKTPSPTSQYSANIGRTALTTLGSVSPGYGDATILSTACDGHGGTSQDYTLYYTANGNIAWGWRAGGSGIDDVYQITGLPTQSLLGTPVPQPNYFTTRRFALGDPNNSNNTRRRQTGTAIPTAGTYAQGDRIEYVNPTPNGPRQADCTTGGSITTNSWAASTAYKVGALVNNGGNCYVAVMPPARQANTAYNVGDVRSNNGRAWTCVQAGTSDVAGSLGPIYGSGPNGGYTGLPDGTCAWTVAFTGTSASSGGPTGTGSMIQDGTVYWNYQPAFVWTESGRRDLAPYTKATLPSAAANSRLQVWVSDDANGAQAAISTGSGWVRVADLTAVA